MPQWYDDVAAALGEYGLIARGAFHPGPADDAPAGTGTILLAGNAGPGMWTAFAAAEMPSGGDPLDDAIPDRIPADIRRFVRGCLLESPGMRPQDAWELHHEFSELLEGIYGPPKYHRLAILGRSSCA